MTVIKFKETAAIVKRISRARWEDGDFLGSLTILRGMESKPRVSADIYAEIAEVYEDMGLYEFAVEYWYKYIDVCPDSKIKEGYMALGEDYLYLENVRAATHYYNERAIEDGVDFPPVEELTESLMDAIDKKRKYRIVYPEKFKSYLAELSAGRLKIREGAFDEGIEILSKIPKEADDYAEALSSIGIAYYLSDRPEEAVTKFKEAYDSNPSDVFTLCNLSSVLHLLKRDAESDEYTRRLLELDATTPADLSKIAGSLCERGMHKKAINYLDKLLITNPFDINALFMRGIASLNIGEYAVAKSSFGDILAIYNSPVAVYYYDVACERLSSGCERKSLSLGYSYKIPEEEGVERIKYIKNLLALPKSELIRKMDKRTEKIIDWALYSKDVGFVKLIVALLMVIGGKKTEKKLLALLLKPVIGDEVKTEILAALVVGGFSGVLGVVFSDIYSETAIERFPRAADKVLLNAYGYALAYDARVLGEDDIYTAALEIDLALESRGYYKEELDPMLLAAAIFFIARDEAKLRETAKLFGVKSEPLKKLILLTKEGKDNEDN